jgi:hypothetical protein
MTGFAEPDTSLILRIVRQVRGCMTMAPPEEFAAARRPTASAKGSRLVGMAPLAPMLTVWIPAVFLNPVNSGGVPEPSNTARS